MVRMGPKSPPAWALAPALRALIAKLIKSSSDCRRWPVHVSNGLTFKLYNIFLQNFQDRYQMTREQRLKNFTIIAWNLTEQSAKNWCIDQTQSERVSLSKKCHEHDLWIKSSYRQTWQIFTVKSMSFVSLLSSSSSTLSGKTLIADKG